MNDNDDKFNQHMPSAPSFDFDHLGGIESHTSPPSPPPLPPSLQHNDLSPRDMAMVVWLMETERHGWVDAFLAIIQHPQNPLATLTIDDLQAIFEKLSPNIDGNDLASLFGSFTL